MHHGANELADGAAKRFTVRFADAASYCFPQLRSDKISDEGTDVLTESNAKRCAHVEAVARSQQTANEGVLISYMMSRTASSSLLTIH